MTETDTEECTCETPNPETDIVDKGRGPNTVAQYRVTYCIDCNGEIEVERL